MIVAWPAARLAERLHEAGLAGQLHPGRHTASAVTALTSPGDDPDGRSGPRWRGGPRTPPRTAARQKETRPRRSPAAGPGS